MKYLRIFLILLLIPFIVLAEECDVSNIAITSMKPNKIEGNTEVISDPTFEDRTINLNLKMYDVNDSITYDLVIKNDSEEDYMIDEDTFKTNSDYIEYTLKTKDNTNVVKANSTKEVSLIVTYKKEVEDDKLTNNKFNASNTLKLSLNTSEKEQPLDIITTDNIKESLDPQEVKNPITSVSSMMLISIILLTSIVIIYILVKRKNKYTKYLLILLSMILIPTVYAICTCDIEVESTIEIEKLPKLYDIVVGLSNEQDACVTKYEGEVTDEVGKTVPATNVYFDTCPHHVIFGGYCWQVVRTTETGGVKMIYNGEPLNGTCLYNRETHKGILGTVLYNQGLNESYLYGSSFTYNPETGSFILKDTFNSILNNSNYENLIGKYTCKTLEDTCSTIYYLSYYSPDAGAKIVKYNIDMTNYAQIGTGPFNVHTNSLSMVGYMFNKTYDSTNKSIGTTNYLYGNSFTYDSNTNLYTLSGETKTINKWNTNYTQINNTHYTCWNTTGICETISYITEATQTYPHHITLNNGKGIEDIIDEMLYSEDVNFYPSAAKNIVDNWYNSNLVDRTNQLEDTVFCNARDVKEWAGWNPNGGVATLDLRFKNYGTSLSLVCNNITDQFATNNNKAKLTYPIALLTNEEQQNTNKSLRSNNWFLTMSPNNYKKNATIRNVDSSGYDASGNVSGSVGIRPVISLANFNVVKTGTGSEEDPWIIE